MFQIKDITKVLILVFCLFQSSAFAGIVVGNGGFGVLIDGKLFLQDLVEAGIHQAPAFSRRQGLDPQIKQAVQQSLVSLEGSPEFQDLLAGKLEDLKAMDPFLAYSITAALQKYSWRMVTVPLDNPNDNDGVIDEGKIQYRQLALRRGTLVRIQKNNWDQLNTENQVALIFHEMIYALMKMDSNISKAENSQRARDLTGYLFSADFYNRGFAGLQTAFGSSWALGDGEPATLKDGQISTAFRIRYSGFYSESADDPNHNLTFTEGWNFEEPKSQRVSRVCSAFGDHGLSFARFTFAFTTFELKFIDTNDTDADLRTALSFDVRPRRMYEVIPHGFSDQDCTLRVDEVMTKAEAYFTSHH